MKNIYLKISSLTLALLLLIGVNSCKKDIDEPVIPIIPTGDVMVVSDLIAMASNVPHKFTEDKSVYGMITLGEENGALYKEAYFQDANGGIKLELLSSSGLKAGDSIRIYLKGTRIYNYHNQVVLDSLHITDNVIRISAGNPTFPKEVTVSDITTGAYTGQLVKIMDIQFKDSDLGKTWADAATNSTANRDIENCDQATLIVRTSGYANFAGLQLPQGKGSMVAIASVYNADYQLYVRSMTEVEMDGIRCDGGSGGGEPVDPVDFVNEDFSAAVDYSDISFEGWTNVVVQGDRKWQGKAFNSDKYTQASGYNSGLAAMETWLITPPVKNISEKVLSLKTAKSFWAHGTDKPLTIFISTDFVGDNFETAIWEELDVTIATESSSDNAWIESGDVDLSAYSGNAAIAFKYVGSDAESTSFRLDDIVIDVSGGGGGEITPVDAIDENFDDAVNYSDIDFEGWTNINVEGDRKWQGKEYESDKYTQASGHNSGLAIMETWLITPPITNIENKVLSLKTAKAFWSHLSNDPLVVMVSEDFVGTNFGTATWTEIDITIAVESDGDHAWISSGDYPLSAFSGNAAIAFKYLGSDTEKTSYRLDDILVQ